MIIIIIINPLISLPDLIFISVPDPSQSQSRLNNNHSTNLRLPLLFLSVSGWFMALLHPLRRSQNVRMHCQKCRAFMTWKIRYIWRNTLTKLFKMYKTGVVPGKPGRKRSIIIHETGTRWLVLYCAALYFFFFDPFSPAITLACISCFQLFVTCAGRWGGRPVATC